MGMSSLKLLKYALFFFSLLFWFCGCCILGFGMYFLIHNNFGVLFHNLPSLTLGNVFVIVGSIIMVVAFLGCMCSIKENKCLLMSFFILLQIILLAEVTLAILLFVYEQKLNKSCYTKARLWFYSNFLYIGIITICVCIIQELGMSLR
ncbi:leukocyte surface antigen CD53-like [Otolemur garnettii]|uniref:leukocyte surface antigen CD53-like n=1 Tax=Otolemur garnettii TaxID=30611 RepID=UPI000C7F22D7|nr:leukocyte surface antigen CD53-like [Otolemur garnettii]